MKKVFVSFLLAALFVLCGCSAAIIEIEPSPPVKYEPVQLPAPTIAPSPVPDTVVAAKDVDEFLAAIAPGITIKLPNGSYDLSTASNYGQENVSDYYRWLAVDDGYELQIHDADGLVIKGSDTELCTIVTTPRMANVLSFRDISDIKISGLTLGHTEKPGHCEGSVVYLEAVENFEADACGLFGCGSIGLNARDSRNVSLKNSRIFDCSQMAVHIYGCSGVSIENCDIRDCGEASFSVFYVGHTVSFTLSGSQISNCTGMNLFNLSGIDGVQLVGNEFVDNRVEMSVFAVTDHFLMSGCSFSGTDFGADGTWYADEKFLGDPAPGSSFPRAYSEDGAVLEDADINAMQLQPSAPPASSDADEGLGIYFGQNRIQSDCTMRVGDEPLTLTAAFGGVLPAKGAVWESSNPEILKVTGNDSTCIVEILGSVAGGVTLTVTADGQQEIISIYCVE